jgi:amino acid transporter
MAPSSRCYPTSESHSPSCHVNVLLTLLQYCSRYVDPAMGFAVGWNNWYQCAITLCAEISAAAIVIGFWNDSINQAAWISMIIVLIICLNIFAVAIYGEAEFIFASIKILTIVGLIFMALILDLGGGPSKDRLGFRKFKYFKLH